MFRQFQDEFLEFLVGNAFKRTERDDALVRIHAQDARDVRRFRVCDNGPGVAPGYGPAILQELRNTDTMIEIARDVTQQRKQAEFEQQLLGIVSHDLRNPIAAMVMGGTLLAELLPEESHAGVVAAHLGRSGARASRLIEDFWTSPKFGSPADCRCTPPRSTFTDYAAKLSMSSPSRTPTG